VIMKPLARWTLVVTGDLNRRVRLYLASVGRKGDLSRFVEEAVESRLLELQLKSLPNYRTSANDKEPAPAAPVVILDKTGSTDGQ